MRSSRFVVLWLCPLALAVAVATAACRPPDCRSTGSCPADERAACTAARADATTTRTVTWGTGSIALVGGDDGSSTTTILLRGRPYLRIESRDDPMSASRTTTTRYGAYFTGIREMTVTTADGEIVAGTIDGRPLAPFGRDTPPEELRFADGTAPPPVNVDPAVTGELKALLEAARSALPACDAQLPQPGPDDPTSPVTSAPLAPVGSPFVTRPAPSPAGPELGFAPPVRPLFGAPSVFAFAVAPHTYSRGLEAACVGCNLACNGTAAGCEIGMVLGCMPSGFTPFGIGYAACVGIGSAVCAITWGACMIGCNTARPGPCCPIACGPACCGTSDTCLNPTTGMCCPVENPQACGGTTCCLATDQCSPSTATCCAAGTVMCGGNCCAAGSSCVVATGECCPPGQNCNTTCGAPGTPCCSGGTCAPGSGCGADGRCTTCPTAPTVITLFSGPKHMGSNCFGNDVTLKVPSPGTTCNPGFRHARCEATPSVSNGSLCTATWQSPTVGGDCTCDVRIQTPSDCSKWIDCNVIVTETTSPAGCP